METRWEAGRCGCRCPRPSGVCSRAGCLDFIPSTSHTGLLPRCTWDVLGNVFFLAFSHQTLGTRFTIQIVCSCTAEKILHLSLMCLLLMMKTWVLNVNLWQVRRDHDAKKPDLESSAFHRHDGEWVGPMLQTLKEGAHRPTHGIYFEGSQKSLQAEWKKPRVGDGEDAGHRQQLRHRWSWRARVEGRVRWVLYNISVRTIIKGHL